MPDFKLPEDNDSDPREYWSRCLEYPEHEHLKNGKPTVGFLLRAHPKLEAGRQVLGSVHMPQVTGKLRDVFTWMVEFTFGGIPDYLVILDAGYWESVDDRLREILMFHEMSHCVQKTDRYGEPQYSRITGEPVWGLVGHDVEEFTAVVARYGAWNDDIESFVAAANRFISPTVSQKSHD